MRICVDLHTHSHHSLDARYSPAEMARAAAERGLDAIAICDHNVWAIFSEDRSALGVLVLPAVEYSTTAGHIIGLFMEAPPTVTPVEKHYYDPRAVVEAIHGAGGLAVAAHPFPEEDEIEKGKRRISLCDGVEVFNARAMASRPTSTADALAAAEGKFCTAGSDSHAPDELGGARLYLEVEALTADAIRQALLRRDGVITGYPSSMGAKARSNYKKAKTPRQKLRARGRILLHTLWDGLRVSVMGTRYTVDLKNGSCIKQKERRDLCR